MTPEKFSTIAAALPGTRGKASAAAYRVLVEGEAITDAAKAVQVSSGAVARLLARMRALEKTGCPTCGHSFGGD